MLAASPRKRPSGMKGDRARFRVRPRVKNGAIALVVFAPLMFAFAWRSFKMVKTKQLPIAHKRAASGLRLPN